MFDLLNGLFWILFGLLIGWIAAILRDDVQLTPHSISLAITGAIGGLAGGLFSTVITPTGSSLTAQSDGLFFAVIGAIAFVSLALTSANRHKSPR